MSWCPDFEFRGTQDTGLLSAIGNCDPSPPTALAEWLPSWQSLHSWCNVREENTERRQESGDDETTREERTEKLFRC